MRELDGSTDLDASFPPFSSSPQDTEPDESDDETPADGFREGLPKTYRSRHDLHYVEALTADRESQPVRLLAIARIEGETPAEHAVADLAKSIGDVGVLQPLLVRPQGGNFQIIAGRRRLAAARRAGLTEVPCLVYAVSDTRAVQLAEADNLRGAPEPAANSLIASAPDLAPAIDLPTAATLGELQDVVASLQSCLPLLVRPAASIREQVALKLVAAETERAMWVMRARQYLAATVPITYTPIGGAALLDHVKRLAGPSLELRGGTLQVDPVRGALMLHGDRTLLTTALAGLVQVLFALGEAIQDPRVVLRLAGVAGGGPSVLTLTQPAAIISDIALARFFDSDWTGRPGGAASELAVLLARQMATLHRARLEVSSGTGVGTTVSLTFGG